jgi:hypothetical protein
MVEQWSPKPQVKGSNPFSLYYTSQNLVEVTINH